MNTATVIALVIICAAAAVAVYFMVGGRRAKCDGNRGENSAFGCSDCGHRGSCRARRDDGNPPPS
ncbi:MAG: hypothetical protein LBN02_03505 [Oscillospiraceae bacterium]|jgi:hypothetical protein|nr:hypothetical protein [Oscillospiraceae bacterium]